MTTRAHPPAFEMVGRVHPPAFKTAGRVRPPAFKMAGRAHLLARSSSLMSSSRSSSRSSASSPSSSSYSSSGGWSLVEVLVGITVGLLLVTAASGWTLGNVRAASRALAMARLAVDLHTAAGAIAADVRRAGHWDDAASTLQPTSGNAAPVNPYAAVVPAAAASDGVAYAYTRPVGGNGAPGGETVGHRLRAGVLESSLGGSGWQALTDPAALRVTTFTVEPVSSVVPLDALCAVPCAASASGCPPTLTVRSLRITLVARSAVDASVVLGTTATSRLRNDVVAGGCGP